MGKCILFFLIVLLSSMCCRAQIKLSGTVKDSTGHAICYATVAIVNQALILKGYTLSDATGNFSFALPDNTKLNGLSLQVTCLGLKKFRICLQPEKIVYHIVMQSEGRNLTPVVIKGERQKIKIKGDTLTYDVRAFSSPNDRVIEDVLKKMPGIDVDDKGKITYNGKPITNFYLDGDNLLDDKYAMGTKNIPNRVVDKVQILDNHQPIKALAGKSVIDQVDINITFRDSAKIKPISQARLSAGLPGNYDEMVSTMLFSGKYKSINYFKTNNIGTDLAEEVTSFNLDDMLKRLDVTPPDKLLAISTTGNPDLPSYRYLFNNTGIFNFNNLITLKPDIKLKANIYYLYDRQSQTSSTQTSIFLPGENPVSYSEKLSDHTAPNLLHGSLNLNVNKDKYYLDNTLTADINKQDATADLQTNGVPVGQRLNNQLRNFSNELNYIGVGKETIEVYSYINYVTRPESLAILPGINADYFNNNLPYAAINQAVEIPSFFTNTYLAFRFASSKFQQAYKIGFNTSNEPLQSNLSKTLNDGSIALAGDSVTNDLRWTRDKAFAEANYNYKTDRLTLNLTLPLGYQHINYLDSTYSFSKQLNNILFNPSASIKLLSGAENYFNLFYRYRTDFGTIEDAYRGDILVNYRYLYSNDAPLTQSNTHSAGASFNYREGIRLLFISVGAVYSKKSINTIDTRIITTDFEERALIPLNNVENKLQLTSSLSKYLFDLHTTLIVKLSWQLSQYNQILNNSLVGYNNYSTTASINTDSKINDRLYFNYNSAFTHFESVQSSGNEITGSQQQVNQLRQKAVLNFMTIKDLSLNLIGEDYYYQQTFSKTTNYLFSDATLKYRIKYYKIDLEAGVLNLTNVKTFSATSVSSNTTTTSIYDIRDRIAMVKISFNF